MVFFPARTQKVSAWVINRVCPARLRAPLSGIVARFITGLSSLRSPIETLKVLLLSIAIWTCETGLYWA